MTTVTKESLETWIRRLERDKEIQGALSIREEHTLAAYRMLSVYVRDCKHVFNWHPGKQKAICEYCKVVKDD